MLEATGHKFGVAIELTKRIPVRAGLGGGSSDAAAALHAVNLLAGNTIPVHELLHFATRLGADVAFFASGAPCAVGWGRGERLFRFTPPAALPTLIGVPSPPLGVATADGLYRSQMRFGMYRWHVTDPVRFASDIRVTVQALGWRADRRYLPLHDDTHVERCASDSEAISIWLGADCWGDR